tara:strand:- start:1417 stop:1689 length:273 start_codon:yes stop_codon:yes gene_type:complete
MDRFSAGFALCAAWSTIAKKAGHPADHDALLWHFNRQSHALKNWVIVYSYGLFDQFLSVTYCNQVSLQCNVKGGLILAAFAASRVEFRIN